MDNSTHTIVYVDDDDLVALQEALQETGQQFALHTAYNGKEGLEKLNYLQNRLQVPCIIVVDINMPLIDGKEF